MASVMGVGRSLACLWRWRVGDQVWRPHVGWGEEGCPHVGWGEEGCSHVGWGEEAWLTAPMKLGRLSWPLIAATRESVDEQQLGEWPGGVQLL